jgi:peptidylprolyl isomerase
MLHIKSMDKNQMNDKMKVVKGNKVKVHYTGTLDDGTQFDSSAGREALGFEVGAGMMIKGFDDAVFGMQKGDKKKIHIEVADAYGEYREDLLNSVPKEHVPPELNPQVGQKLAVTQENGSQVSVTVKEVTDKKVVIDANHELAGKALNFEIELVEISK